LKVSSSIQPTSAPTGTDDDNEGNDKADALTTNRWMHRKRVSRF
jgi:hypothetical protein